MARFTFLRQDATLKTDVYGDAVAAGEANLVTAATVLEDDLNSLRSQVNRILAVSTGNWYDDIATANGKKRALSELNTDLDDLETKIIVCNATVLTDITVTAAQNWEILSVAGSETPTQVAAVAATQPGAIVAQSALNGAGFNVAEATLVAAGPNALNPANLLSIRDATTKAVIESVAGGNSRDVMGLLQYESTGVDGGAFNDTSEGNRVKITFVRINAAGTALEACPVGDIAGKTIEYNYNFQVLFDNIDRNCFISNRGFVDQAAAVDVTLDTAIDNQSGNATQEQNINVQIGDNFTWAFLDDAAANLLSVESDTVGGGSTVAIGAAVDVLDIDAISVDFASGVTIGSGGANPLQLGVTTGLIQTTAGDLTLGGTNGETILNDSNMVAEGTWAGPGVKVSETTAEVSAYETAFGGEVSLMNALVQAKNSSAVRKVVSVVTANISADADASLGDTNLSVALGDLSTGTFVDDYDIYVNGQLLVNGVDAAANRDVYPGTSLAAGQLKFEFNLKATPNNADVITLFDRAG